VLQTARETLDSTRQVLLNGGEFAGVPVLIQHIQAHLEAHYSPSLRPVINATGVIIHTNLGRALLSESAQQALQDIASQYNTLEFTLETGKRGSRYVHAEVALCELTGAEAALVVNNNAAALVLLLGALAQHKEVVISRAHLVEIGGGFRVPDIMLQSGALLKEVGTTNRTRLNDYAQAINPNTALLMRVHSSNFKIIGFTEETPLSDLAQLAHEQGIHLVDDLGSGTLIDTTHYGLAHEPTVQESIQDGVDVVAFSGDKLLGGPQAGILVGKKELITRLKQHPLARALRADKLCYAALGATLDHYRKGQAIQHIPVWQMISRSMLDIQSTAQRWANELGGTVIHGESTIGGGSLPGETLATALLALEVSHPQDFLRALRHLPTPIIARIQDDRVLFDPRTVLPTQEQALLKGIQQAQKNLNTL
jgi:L-seryl-tRNA(Ser) seleniumtransferase